MQRQDDEVCGVQVSWLVAQGSAKRTYRLSE